ncbi:MAG: hypothetical protein KC547_07275, partial [Anaerolineae bacterium]|nr:hypothetical protein [Anaerolineae bacterium]
YLAFCRSLFGNSALDTVPLSLEINAFYARVFASLRRFQTVLDGSFSAAQRRHIMDELGETGSDFRWQFYQNGLSGEVMQTPVEEIVAFLDVAQAYVEHSLRANKRNDNLFHAYNILHLTDGAASVGHLYEMLEGQVAILASGLLSGDESLALLRSLRHSALYQPEQQSYILYPERSLPGFLQKNCLTPDQVSDVALLGMLTEKQDKSLVMRDADGVYHFSGHIRNLQDVNRALDSLKSQPWYAELVEAESQKIKALFEATFHHNEFTGRSGTFFAYEGLGSVYWHMVAKLLLAAQETALRFKGDATADALRECYADIRRGFGFNKPPQAYGAFPADPYSHTPKGQGAKQPGMTGMVKEVILTRRAETGFDIAGGKLVFDPILMDRRELLTRSATFSYLDVRGQVQEIELPTGSLAYTICQTPVVFQSSERMCITVHHADGAVREIAGHALDEVTSSQIFQRDGAVSYLTVSMLLNE